MMYLQISMKVTVKTLKSKTVIVILIAISLCSCSFPFMYFNHMSSIMSCSCPKTGSTLLDANLYHFLTFPLDSPLHQPFVPVFVQIFTTSPLNRDSSLISLAQKSQRAMAIPRTLGLRTGRAQNMNQSKNNRNKHSTIQI